MDLDQQPGEDGDPIVDASQLGPPRGGSAFEPARIGAILGRNGFLSRFAGGEEAPEPEPSQDVDKEEELDADEWLQEASAETSEPDAAADRAEEGLVLPEPDSPITAVEAVLADHVTEVVAAVEAEQVDADEVGGEAEQAEVVTAEADTERDHELEDWRTDDPGLKPVSDTHVEADVIELALTEEADESEPDIVESEAEAEVINFAVADLADESGTEEPDFVARDAEFEVEEPEFEAEASESGSESLEPEVGDTEVDDTEVDDTEGELIVFTTVDTANHVGVDEIPADQPAGEVIAFAAHQTAGDNGIRFDSDNDSDDDVEETAEAEVDAVEAAEFEPTGDADADVDADDRDDDEVDISEIPHAASVDAETDRPVNVLDEASPSGADVIELYGPETDRTVDEPAAVAGLAAEADPDVHAQSSSDDEAEGAVAQIEATGQPDPADALRFDAESHPVDAEEAEFSDLTDEVQADVPIEETVSEPQEFADGADLDELNASDDDADASGDPDPDPEPSALPEQPVFDLASGTVAFAAQSPDNDNGNYGDDNEADDYEHEDIAVGPPTALGSAVEIATESGNEPVTEDDAQLPVLEPVDTEAEDDDQLVLLDDEADEAGSVEAQEDVDTLPTMENLRTMAAELDEVDAILERLDSDEDALFADLDLTVGQTAPDREPVSQSPAGAEPADQPIA